MANDFKNYNKVADPTVRKHFFDFSGGMNDTDPEHLIADNEMADAKNCLIEGTSIVKRKGSQYIEGTDVDATTTYTLKHNDGTNYLIFNDDSNKIYYLSGSITGDNSLVEIYADYSRDENTRFGTYFDKLFITNKYNYIQSWDGVNAVTDLAVTPDHTTETFTAVAHGLLDNDRVRFSGTTVPTGLSFSTTYYVVNKAADTFQVSTTLGGGAAAFTANGVAVTVTEHTHIYSDLPIAAATVNDRPSYFETFKERLIMANTTNFPNRVYYSNVGLTDGLVTIETNNYFDVDAPITTIKVYNDNLYIFTEDKKFRVDGFVFNKTGSEPERIIEIPNSHGTISDRSVQTVDGIMYFLARNDVYAFNGSEDFPIATPKINNLFKSLSQKTLDSAVSGQKNHRYYLYANGYGNGTVYYLTLVFDVINKAWTYNNNQHIYDFCLFPNDDDELELIGLVNGYPAILETAYNNQIEKNLVSNHSFETLTGGATDPPDDWTESIEAGSTGDVRQSDFTVGYGDYSILLYRTTGSGYVKATQTITAPSANSNFYEYSFWIRTSELAGSSNKIYVRFVESGGDSTVYETLYLGDKYFTYGKYFHGTVQTGDGEDVIIELCIDNSITNSSTVYFDKFNLAEVSITNIFFDVSTKTHFLGNPQRLKKFKNTFISAKSAQEFNLDDETYNLTTYYSSGFNSSETFVSLSMNNDDGIVEEIIDTKMKARHIQYRFYNPTHMEPIELYGYTINVIPLDKYK